MGFDLRTKPWWDYLDEDLRELLDESFLLSESVKMWGKKFHDYAFVVFPAAKAYEGFLKKFFLDMQLLTQDDYYSKHFRIGKSLNPQLEKRFREKESIYDKLMLLTNSRELPDELWTAWKVCRNSVFHWFPDEKTVVSFDESKKRIAMIIAAIDKAYAQFRMELKHAV